MRVEQEKKKKSEAFNGHIRNMMMIMMMLLMFGDQKSTKRRFVSVLILIGICCVYAEQTLMLNGNNAYHSHSSISDAITFTKGHKRR